MFRLTLFLRSTIGKKVLMAVTGVVLLGFCVGHLTGNLLFFKGRDAINGYAAFLHGSPALLWAFRAVLLVSAVLHVVLAAQLFLRQQAARPVGYRMRRYIFTSYAARTMIVTGPLIAVFLFFHLAHLTWGWKVVPAAFVPGDVHANMLAGFRTGWVTLIYVATLAMLALHLLHGAHSMFESLGLRGRRVDGLLVGLAKVVTLAVAVGFVAAPVAVFLRIVQG
jgi:succinate dehydrogenase / fumarate reductase cytochrome b subunit